MSEYRVDLKDIEFNLFELLKVQDQAPDLSKEDLKGILGEYLKFVSSEVYPTRERGDIEGLKYNQGEVRVPSCFEQPQKLYYDNGWFPLGLREEYTDIVVPQSIYMACMSLLTGANVSFAMYSGLSRAALNTILKVGSEEIKQKVVAPMIDGRFGGTMCLTEAFAGSDVGALKTKAVKQKDGTYKINGTKIFISSGENNLYQNIIHLVLAKTDPSKDGTKGLSLFVVPKYRLDGAKQVSNNVYCSKIEEKMGLHAQATCELVFGQKGDCVGYLLGNEFEGMINMFIMMNEARLLCGIQGEAQGALAYQLSEKYAGEREQFGKSIQDHPDVKRMLLKMRAMSRGMRALGLYAAQCLDLSEFGQEEQKQKYEGLLGILTPICKSYFTDQGFQLCVDAVQIHGGYGYCREYGVEQMVRDVKIASIYEGTNGIQAIDLVMRKILKDGGKFLGSLIGKIGQSLELARKEPKLVNSQSFETFQKSLQGLAQIGSKLGDLAKANKVNDILWKCCDALEYLGHQLIAWRLLDGAHLALQKLKEPGLDSETQKFYQEKVVDYKVFCDHFLVKNVSLGRMLLSDLDPDYN